MPSAQNVLLAIHIKRTDNVELKNPILSYIRETYSDREAEDAVDDLVAIQTLRNELVATQAGSQLTAKDSYIKCANAQRFDEAAVHTCMHVLCVSSCRMHPHLPLTWSATADSWNSGELGLPPGHVVFCSTAWSWDAAVAACSATP
eukprot:GHRQ01027578.1.p1 GENE.GHRQ01027578.1~~GHRQ01027578.1.p1  ORF type:complete len:146 (-),score=20.63 GHRQ01027578.1:334-771(-)